MVTRRERLAQIEEAIAAHPKGKPLNASGQLVPDPTPMAPPVGYKKQPSMLDIIRDQVRNVGREAERLGYESFEEADDFDVSDDPEISSPYEVDVEAEIPVSILRQRMFEQGRDAAEAAAAAKKAPGAEPPGAAPPPKEGRATGGEPPGERSA